MRARKPKLPVAPGGFASHPRLYDRDRYALTPPEVAWAAREANAAPDYRRLLRRCHDELEGAFGGPKDQSEEEAALLQEIRDVLKLRRKGTR